MSWCVAAACWVMRVSGLPGPEPHIFVVHDTDNGSRERTSLGQAWDKRCLRVSRNATFGLIQSPYQHVCRRLSWFSVSSAQPFPVFIERISLHKEQIRGGASFLFFFNASLISRRGKIDTTRLVMRELPHRARGAGSDSNTGIAIDCFGY